MGFLYEGGSSPKNVALISTLISCTLSFVAIITCLIFPRIRAKMFMMILFWISLSSFIANATVLSKTPGDFWLCALQGALQQFFYPASWLWTTVLTYLLYSLVIDGKISMPWWQMHAICWGIPAIITFIPLSTEYYGSSNNDDDWCWLQPMRSGTLAKGLNEFWQISTFDGLILACFALMSYWGFQIYWNLRVQKIDGTPMVISALNILCYYPVIIFITWFPNAILLAMNDDHLPQDGWVMVFVNSLSLWQGGLIAIVFFVKSREARSHWYVLYLLIRARICGASTRNMMVSSNAASDTGGSERASQDRPSAHSTLGDSRPSAHSFFGRHSVMSELVEDFADDAVYRGLAAPQNSVATGGGSSQTANTPSATTSSSSAHHINPLHSAISMVSSLGSRMSHSQGRSSQSQSRTSLSHVSSQSPTDLHSVREVSQESHSQQDLDL